MFKLLKKVGRLVFPGHTVKGTENVVKGAPSVFACNHAGAYGPVVMQLFFPYKYRPWVIHSITEPGKCAKYLADNFLKDEVNIPEPFNKWIAAVIAPLCIKIMKAVEAIPVYRGKTQIMKTFQTSLEAFMKGYAVLIFPENKDVKFSKFVDGFYTGFVYLARQLYRKTGQKLYFYPVYASFKKKTITIGKPITYSPDRAIKLEREVVANYLRDSIHAIAQSQEDDRPMSQNHTNPFCSSGM